MKVSERILHSFLQSRDSVMTPDRHRNPTVADVPKTSLFSAANSDGIDLMPRFEQTLKITNGYLSGGNGIGLMQDGVSYKRIKRTLDVCLSLILLILLLPLTALIAAAIWAQADGPLLYVSRRIGRYGRPFTFYKFRTMIVNADSLKDELNPRNKRSAILFKVPNDPRITRLGRILRKYSLDEIPQLINVLRGEMSLVGPRPSLASEVEQYNAQHFVRLMVLPGLTGLWQVRARTSPLFEDYIDLDLMYIYSWSVWLDVKILWRTVWVVLAGTGE